MIRTFGIVIAAAGIALAPAQAGEAKVNHKVEIDGRSYRVEVKGQVVEIFDKSVFTKRSPESGARLRAALRQATGCGIKDEYWETAHLVGMLDCAAAAPKP